MIGLFSFYAASPPRLPRNYAGFSIDFYVYVRVKFFLLFIQALSFRVSLIPSLSIAYKLQSRFPFFRFFLSLCIELLYHYQYQYQYHYHYRYFSYYDFTTVYDRIRLFLFFPSLIDVFLFFAQIVSYFAKSRLAAILWVRI